MRNGLLFFPPMHHLCIKPHDEQVNSKDKILSRLHPRVDFYSNSTMLTSRPKGKPEMLADLNPEQRALADYMSEISEESWHAGWLSDLEYQSMARDHREMGLVRANVSHPSPPADAKQS
jgi:hypothetical protein